MYDMLPQYTMNIFPQQSNLTKPMNNSVPFAPAAGPRERMTTRDNYTNPKACYGSTDIKKQKQFTDCLIHQPEVYFSNIMFIQQPKMI